MALGWEVIRVWEHESPAAAAQRSWAGRQSKEEQSKVESLVIRIEFRGSASWQLQNQATSLPMARGPNPANW